MGPVLRPLFTRGHEERLELLLRHIRHVCNENAYVACVVAVGEMLHLDDARFDLPAFLTRMGVRRRPLQGG